MRQDGAGTTPNTMFKSLIDAFCAQSALDVLLEYFEYLLDFACLNRPSSTECSELVAVFQKKLAPLLMQGHHHANLRKQIEKLRKVLQEAPEGEASRKALNELQFGLADQYDQESVALPETMVKSFSLPTDVIFSEKLHSMISSLAEGYKLSESNENYQFIFKALKKIIDLQLFAYKDANYEIRCKCVAQAMQLACSGLIAARKINDSPSERNFSEYIDICFAHFLNCTRILFLKNQQQPI